MPIVLTGNQRPAAGAASRAGAGGMGNLPDPATIAPMRSEDMPGLPATMPRPMPNRSLRQTAPAMPSNEASPDTSSDAAAPR